jgi:peptidoglycan L-alanyl-D-glutamate endopeptidase CwlK
MPKFSMQSKVRLAGCHPKLQELFNEVIKTYDCSILCGYRGKVEQDKAVMGGMSKTPFPTSKHNKIPSMAVDAAPYPVDWKDEKRFAHFAGYVKATADRLGIKIRWGNDWDQDGYTRDETFHDMPHFEYIGG